MGNHSDPLSQAPLSQILHTTSGTWMVGFSSAKMLDLSSGAADRALKPTSSKCKNLLSIQQAYLEEESTPTLKMSVLQAQMTSEVANVWRGRKWGYVEMLEETSGMRCGLCWQAATHTGVK